MNKIEKFQKILKKNFFDAYLISKDINIKYLTDNYNINGYLIILKEKNYIIINSMFEEQIINQTNSIVIVYKKNFIKTFISIIKKEKIKNLYFEKTIVFFKYLIFKKSLKNINCKFIMGPEIIENLRMIKDKKEIELIKESAKITDNIFKKILNVIRPGITEIDLKKKLEYFLTEEKADSFSFPLIITSGNRTSLPHGAPTEKKIKNNEPILFDLGVIYKNYCSDMTRMIYLGKPNFDFMNIYEIINEMQFLILEYLLKNKSSLDIDLMCRKIISKYGYLDNFNHGTGHGVGLEIHEKPFICQKEDLLLKNNMVFTIEPGIYFKNKFGVRIENLFVLNNINNIEILSKTNQNLIII